MIPTVTILEGDCLERLRELPDESVHCVVTSPPYWGLRDYGVAAQIGLEPTPEAYLSKMVEVFQEVRRVLRCDGVLFCNMGDSYASGELGRHDKKIGERMDESYCEGKEFGTERQQQRLKTGLKPKDLVGMPWRLAFALQADGWFLRQDIIWHKPNPMPESVTDRCTKAHEYIFMLSKSARYFWDAEAIKEPLTPNTHPPGNRTAYDANRPDGMTLRANRDLEYLNQTSRNKRSVWTVPSFSYPESHFATYPPDLIKPCILAGTSAKGCCPKCRAPWERIVDSESISEYRPETTGAAKKSALGDMARTTPQGRTCGSALVKTLGWRSTCTCDCPDTIPCTVLDPFAGSFTTCAVSLELGRNSIGIDLNPNYIKLGKARTTVTPGLPLS